MIIVRDNGMMYSDHKLEFIEAPDGVALDSILDFLEYSPWYAERAKVIATAAAFEWRHPTAVPLRDWLSDLYEDLRYDEDHEAITERIKQYLDGSTS